MRHRCFMSSFIVMAATLGFAAQAPGATTIDFDDLAIGTVVTNDYVGVTFSAVPQSCGGSPVVNLTIQNPSGGTSSGTRALVIGTGCPDFSPDYIRMVFDNPQEEVSFTLGFVAATYQIRAYTTASGGSPLSTQTITIGGSGFPGVHRLVRVTSASSNIKRIEVQETLGNFEAIDDLTFACVDTTPPTVQIDAPQFEACSCGTSVTLRGLSCDPEGFDHDTLEYLAVNAAAGTAWTTVGSATVAQCAANGLLYNWSTGAVADGFYYLRITTFNDCGLSASATTVVCLDRSVDAPVLRSPVDDVVLGGIVCLDGTVWDGPNASCLESYVAQYKPVGAGVWSPVNPATPVYSGSVVNDQLAGWDTRNVIPVVKDGQWQLRMRASNICGADSTYTTRTVVIDNTPPTAVITEPLSCRTVSGLVTIRGTVGDAHLGSWVLQYSGGDAKTWVTPPIASGTSAVSNGVLGTWNTAGLRACAYALRLVVTDTSVVDCVGTHHNQSEYVTTVYVGTSGVMDFDGDDDVDLDDFGFFQRCYSGPSILAAFECRQ